MLHYNYWHVWANDKVKFAGPQYKHPHFPVYLKNLRSQPLKVRRGQHVSSRVADKSTIIIVTTMSSLIKLSNKHVAANKKLSRGTRREVSQEKRWTKTLEYQNIGSRGNTTKITSYICVGVTVFLVILPGEPALISERLCELTYGIISASMMWQLARVICQT